MRQLRLLRLSEESGDLVLESADGLEQFALNLDDTLRAVVASAERPSNGAVPTPAERSAPTRSPGTEVEVKPREVQVRIRAGESPQQLADSLGVDVGRIMRFAGPVLDERMRITDEARRARARRTGTDNDFVGFGEKIDERFSAHGIVPTDVSWDSRRRDDGDWIVAAEWAGGEGRHGAEWLFHRTSRCVTPLDDTASDLLSDRPIRPVVPPQPAPEGRVSLAAAPPLAPGVVAFPPMPDAHTGPLPRVDDVFDQEAPAEGPRAVPPFVPADAPADSAAAEYDEPPLPLTLTDDPQFAGPGTRPLASLANVRKHREDTEDDKAARARVPSWDDILLGVRRGRD